MVTVLWLAGLSPATAQSDLKDDSACAHPVRLEAANAIAGAAAQTAWLRRNFSDAEKVRSTVRQEGQRMVDVITLRKPSGQTGAVCFDISGYFGRF